MRIWITGGEHLIEQEADNASGYGGRVVIPLAQNARNGHVELQHQIVSETHDG
jgi:hypothetical protein